MSVERINQTDVRNKKGKLSISKKQQNRHNYNFNIDILIVGKFSFSNQTRICTYYKFHIVVSCFTPNRLLYHVFILYIKFHELCYEDMIMKRYTQE